jgi:hypothetical protein
MRFYFAMVLYLFSVSVFGQDAELIRALNPDMTPPVQDTPSERVTETQKKLLRKVVDSLSDREIDEYLLRLGLSTEGSVYAKRIRLKESLAKDTPPASSPLTPESKKDAPPFVIENASEGEFLSVDKTRSGVLILRGRVKVKVSEGSLTADSISVDSKKNEIYAEGGIIYKKGPMEIKGDKFIYDINFERGVVYSASASMFPIYFVGKKMKKIDENKYLLDVGYFTSCSAEVPHYTFKAKKLFVYEDQSVVATNLWYNVGGTKMLYVPLYYGTNLGTGWVVQGGMNRTQGTFLQTAYQWSEPLSGTKALSPVGRKIKADYYEKTGPHLGFEFWKVSPWLNYNIDLGVADFRFYNVASRYTNLNQFQLGNFNDVVTTNQVDKGDRCLELGGRCLATYTDLIRSQDPSFNTRIADVGIRRQTWWKGNIVANAKSNNVVADGTRNVYLRFEQYTNPRFEYEFGYRYVPSNTLQSLYTFRTQRNPFIRQNLVWDFDYTETRGDLSVNLAARRNWTYYLLNPEDRSAYFPVRDELPRLSVRNSSQIGTLPFFMAPVYWDMNLNSMIVRLYGPPTKKPLAGSTPLSPIDDPWGRYRESLLRNEYFANMETGVRTNMNFGGYVTFSPGVFVGANKQAVERADTSLAPSTSDTSIERFYKRESYQFLRQNHRLSFGIPELLLSTTYRRKDARNRELPDPVLKDGRDAVHEMEVALESNAFEDFEFSIRTIRDLRQFAENYNPAPTDSERWYFTIFRMGTFYDFYEKGLKRRSTLLERQRSFFSGIFLNNDYVYHTAQNRPLYNNATIGYQMGGFSLPFIRNVRSLEIGGTWYHVFHSSFMANYGSYAPNSAGLGRSYLNTSPFLDTYRFYIQSKLQITRLLGLDLELDSRVTQPWRYTSEVGERAFYRNGQDPYTVAGYTSSSLYQPTNFPTDVANSTGIYGSNARQNSAFNVYRFYMIWKYNIHDFEYQLGYSSDLRAIGGGPSFDSQVTFYDQSVFFAINLINISLGPEQSAGAQTRARVYRFRKQPLDADPTAAVSGGQ